MDDPPRDRHRGRGSVRQTGGMSLQPSRITTELEPIWFNEPRRWRRSGGDLIVTTDQGSDFWRQTRHGYDRDTGHHLGARVPGDFTARVQVHGDYAHQWDQAGLMVRMDSQRWLKSAVERIDGQLTLSTVVTHGVSDWSMTPLPDSPGWVSLRLTRDGDSVAVCYALEGQDWREHRLAFFPPDLPVSVGPMAGSPAGPGFEVCFRGFDVQPTD